MFERIFLTDRSFRMAASSFKAQKVNIAANFKLFDDYWSPRIAGAINDSYVKPVKVKGEFVWHAHEEEDELFLVMNGQLTIKNEGKRP
jgi:mannose-6-phosphate isomerase-like protein (cupin superfamily)